jgi:hypothetical protein
VADLDFPVETHMDQTMTAVQAAEVLVVQAGITVIHKLDMMVAQDCYLISVELLLFMQAAVPDSAEM